MKKKLTKLSLTNLSSSELGQREMNRLLGGENCCICRCNGFDAAGESGGIENRGGGVSETGGYGSGSFG